MDYPGFDSYYRLVEVEEEITYKEAQQTCTDIAGARLAEFSGARDLAQVQERKH